MIKIYNSLCEGCCNNDCNAKNICSKCKGIDTCVTFKAYVDEYYNIIGKEENEELEIDELKEIFVHDYDAVSCRDFDCIDYDKSDEQRRYEEENLKVDECLKNIR